MRHIEHLAGPQRGERPFHPALLATPNIWPADQYFKSGRPWVDVRAFGAAGTTLADDTTPIQNAINAIQTLGGGIVFFSQGNYRVTGTLTVNSASGVHLVGTHTFASAISTITNVKMLLLQGVGRHSVQNLSLLGFGTQGGNGPAVGGTAHTLHVSSDCVDTYLHRLFIGGGFYGVLDDGVDTVSDQVIISSVYGAALWRQTGIALWMRRSKLDNPWPVSVPTPGASFAAWAPATAYNVGDVRSSGGFYIQCSQAGTSGGVAPTLQNYFTSIVDNTARWLLCCATNSMALDITTGASETHVAQSDFSGAQGRCGISINNDGAGVAPFLSILTDNVVSQTIGAGLDAIAGTGLQLSGNEFSAPLTAAQSAIAMRASWAGDASIINNMLFGSTNTAGIYLGSGINHTIVGNTIVGWQSGVLVEANVSKFAIVSNNLGTSTKWGTNTTGIAITAGTSDNYTILGNLLTGATNKVTDGGTGTNKIIQDTESTFSSGLRSTGVAGVGYATGAGGTVTQATSKATAVTLNKITGAITVNAANLAAGTVVSFVFNNTTIAATDMVVVSHESGGTVGSYTVNGRATGAGTAAIDIRNNTAGALAEGMVLRYSVIKSVNV